MILQDAVLARLGLPKLLLLTAAVMCLSVWPRLAQTNDAKAVSAESKFRETSEAEATTQAKPTPLIPTGEL